MAPTELEAKLEAVKQLNHIFRFERLVHLGVTLVSLLILLVSAAVLIWNRQAGPAELLMLFGSSGAITYSAGRLLLMWSEALKLLGGAD